MNKGSDAPLLADDLERLADNTLKSADWFWGWRRRDRKISIAFGQLSRDLRVVATRVRALTKVEDTE